MSKFSVRNGYAGTNEIQIYDITQSIRNRIWNLFYREEILKQGTKRIKSSFKSEGLIEDILLDKCGLLINATGTKTSRLKDFLLNCEWFQVLDFVESHISALNEIERESRVNLYNELFGYEGIKFRLVNEEISPIYNQSEIEAIEQAINTEFDSVNQHIKKALSYFSDRKQPDYENTIKESISAVESMCCIITEKNTTLNKAIEKLKDKGVHIHPAMEKAFISLYGYTSDESGIRHGGIDFTNAPAEDAKYMLVSCSAFVNYLIEKWSKVKEN